MTSKHFSHGLLPELELEWRGSEAMCGSRGLTEVALQSQDLARETARAEIGECGALCGVGAGECAEVGEVGSGDT